jgi:Xaa-Pro aminopeptidase
MPDTLRYAPLIYAESVHCTDMLHLTGFWVHDPFLAFRFGGETYALLSALERARAEKESRIDHILPLEEWTKKASDAIGRRAKLIDVIQCIMESFGIEGFVVPRDFPAWLWVGLQEEGVPLKLGTSPFFPEQNFKSPEALQEIRKANDLVRQCFGAVEKVLIQSAVNEEGYLIHEDQILTSERLRAQIEILCLEHEAIGDCIVAGGDQGCDPHCKGYGPLKANEWIVVDIFPRLKRTGYHGDMTRTFMKGEPNLAQKALYASVEKAQKAALETIRAGASFKTPHEAAVKVFEADGFKTDVSVNPPVGFIHGTGHGVGLGLHEPLSLSPRSEGFMEEGMVVTVEPGLYYPGLGGVRIEDVVVVTKDGYQVL